MHVEGLDDVMVRLSRCCTPVPGDEIIGFVTRGRGVSVHRTDCANAVSLTGGQGDRLIDVEWDTNINGTFVASIEVKALDRARLLRDVARALADHHVNILTCNTPPAPTASPTMRFDFELGDPATSTRSCRTIKQIDSVYDAYRVLPGQGELTGLPFVGPGAAPWTQGVTVTRTSYGLSGSRIECSCTLAGTAAVVRRRSPAPDRVHRYRQEVTAGRTRRCHARGRRDR